MAVWSAAQVSGEELGGKRVAVMGLGGLATMAGVAALSVVGPFVYGHRSPFRFAS